MATATGIVTLALTSGTWIQAPSQAATAVNIAPIGGLQVSLDNGANYIVQKSYLPANPYSLKANLNELYFRIFGAPINVKLAWSS